MSYGHHMSLVATAKAGVTRDQIIPALDSLVRYFDWDTPDLLNGFDGDESLEWEVNTQTGDLKLWLQTCGEVTDNYYDVLNNVAAKLHDLVEPVYFRLVDTSCGNPEEAESKIWIGSGKELELAQREDVIEQVSQLLNGTISDPEWRNAIVEQIRQAPLPLDSNDQAAPTPSAPSF